MTYQLPTEDRFLLTRSELEDRIAVLLGGRVAEELVYGEVSTGAHNDLERATELARLMVTKYGMSERIGLATYGERTPLFLKVAGGGGGERDYSEATARSIDEEVRAILDRTHDRVRGLLTAKKAVLVHAASRAEADGDARGRAAQAAARRRGLTERVGGGAVMQLYAERRSWEPWSSRSASARRSERSRRAGPPSARGSARCSRRPRPPCRPRSCRCRCR